MKYLKIKGWDRWQTFRKDRGTPPWIKVYRNLFSNPDWMELTDCEKGQLVSMWIAAADKSGKLSINSKIIQKTCFLDEPPNLQRFKDLGFLDGNMTTESDNHTPTTNQDDDNHLTTTNSNLDQPETETETEESRVETDICKVGIEFWNIANQIALSFGDPVPDWQVNQWAEEVRDMVIIDKRPINQILERWGWTQAGWWKDNGVKVTPKMLRAKWLTIQEPEKSKSSKPRKIVGGLPLPDNEPSPHNELAQKINEQILFAREHLADDGFEGAKPDADWLNRTVGSMILEYSERWPKGPYMRQFEQKLGDLSSRVLELDI